MKCIVHIPYSLEGAPQSATYLRPKLMCQAFSDIGYDVAFVSGNSSERTQLLHNIRLQISAGVKFDFCYFESCTSPTLLTDKDHIPRAWNLDYRFLAELKKNQIPVGIFLRDMHWRFAQYRDNMPFLKRSVATLFYHYDLLSYSSLADAMFVPSLEFADHLPKYLKFKHLDELPPGGHAVFAQDARFSQSNVESSGQQRIRLIYVGGCHPDLYDLRPLLATLDSMPHFELTLITRSADWERSRHFYDSLIEKLGRRLRVLHAHGKELLDLYTSSDIASVVVAENEYLKLAYPMKLFEALGQGLPILSLGSGTISRFVLDNKIGWNAETTHKLADVMKAITPAGIEYHARRVHDIAHIHSWKARASKVRTMLLSIDAGVVAP